MSADGAPVLRVGTRGSDLALAQSGQIAGRVAGEDRVELVRVRTHGDVDRTSPLAQIGGTGVFVTAVREALLGGEVDVVVHSAKDLPTAPVPGIVMACVPEREDARDALCARDGLTLETLPQGAKVGTGSPRRAAQLRRARADLEVVGIRGNVETRLARALGEDADLDAVVLAAAGLLRLGRREVISEFLSPDVLLPAPAQGALAVECAETSAGAWFEPGMRAADHAPTRAAVAAERSLLRTLEAGCSAPVGALGTVSGAGSGAGSGGADDASEGPVLTLRGLAISEDGTQVFEGTRSTPVDLADPAALEADAVRLGQDLAADLLDAGAARVLSAVGSSAAGQSTAGQSTAGPGTAGGDAAS
ncbi:hydroxymethylbilane synthase [Brachybacterium kimchii]|uniref:Porphobilinogen deaminase n=1 Tax=Brachybacterium kimchii TaxID=2942909 RepID=A0ABY4N0P2_9MICO|nr:hydroxymethylbilane synthase [Brachybacterium kimchii]UQN28127.1 hydroxymethylbilane synthase [Brachybacterium kimchii]